MKKSHLKLVSNNNVIIRDGLPPFKFDLLAKNGRNTYVNGDRVSDDIHALHFSIFRCDARCPVCHGHPFRPATADAVVKWLLWEKRQIQAEQKYYRNDFDWLQKFSQFSKPAVISEAGEAISVSIQLFYYCGTVWGRAVVSHTA